MSDLASNDTGPAMPLERHKHSLLLATLAALLLISPVIDDAGTGGLLLSGLFSVVLIVGAVAVGRARHHLFVVLGLSLGWLYLTWLHPVWSGSPLDDIAAVLLAVCTLYMAAVLLLSILSSERVTHDVICGGIAIYLLFAITWAVIYVLIEGLSPGSFRLGTDAQGTMWDQMLYFSLITLTTLGYGDIAPLSAVARIWAALEAVTGTLFLAILIARLVSLYRR